MTGLLASVRTLDEVDQALAFDADLIDLKEPAAGALGALPPALIAAAVAHVAGQRPVSATVGDLAMEPETLVPEVVRTAECGVGLVKVGFFPGGQPERCVEALGGLSRQGIRIVAVLFADRDPDLDLASRLAAADFAGIMLDTADKRRGTLRDHLEPCALARFVENGRAHGLLVGLAGSLRLSDVAPLAALGPHYLGFRGALCQGRERAGGLDPAACRTLRAELLAAQAVSRASRATATAGRQRPAHSAASGSAGMSPRAST